MVTTALTTEDYQNNHINIYTDSSKTKNHAGSGIAIIKHGNLRHTRA